MDTIDRVTRVDHTDLFSTLLDYRPAHVADEKAKAEKELRAIRKMLEIGILRRHEAGDVYTVDRFIEAALPYATLAALRETLREAPDIDEKSYDSDDGNGVG
jgi:hypothetical protein